jgi:hypothetical protein
MEVVIGNNLTQEGDALDVAVTGKNCYILSMREGCALHGLPKDIVPEGNGR